MANVAVLGTGGWGTALALVINDNRHNVYMWSKFPDEIYDIKKDGENKKLLPGVKIPKTIELTSDLNCIKKCEVVIFAIPSYAVKETAQSIKDIVNKDTIILNASKGLEHNNYKRFSQVISEILPFNAVAVLSGPSHAEEVSKRIPTTIVVSSEDEKACCYIQDVLMNLQFRVYVNLDIIGVELGGALINIIALAVGVSDGLELGDNIIAALVTRGLTEMARLGVSLGAKSETFAGLTGLGDLFVTCASVHSRNRRAGKLIGQGINPQDAIKQVGMVEGYYICKEAYELSRNLGVDMPITEQCYHVLYENKDPRLALKALMERPKSQELEHTWIEKN